MEARHKKELGSSTSATSVEDNSAVVEEPTEATEIKNEPELSKEQSKIEKARRKREKQKEKERAREQAIAEELANAGPTARHVENETIQQQLTPLHMKIQDVTADGHCLYRAVAAQSGQTFLQTREWFDGRCVPVWLNSSHNRFVRSSLCGYIGGARGLAVSLL